MTEAPITSADAEIPIVLGTLHDGRVLMEFRGIAVDHLKLTPERALEMAEGLADAVRDAPPLTTLIRGCPTVEVGALAEGAVVVSFPRAMDHIMLPPAKATEFALMLVTAARAAKGGRKILTGARVHRP